MPPSLTYFQKIWPENLGITVFISLDNRDQSTIVDSNIYMRNWWKLICWCFMTHVFCHAWHKVIYEILPYLSSSKSSIWRSEIPESTVVKKERWYCVKKDVKFNHAQIITFKPSGTVVFSSYLAATIFIPFQGLFNLLHSFENVLLILQNF